MEDKGRAKSCNHVLDALQPGGFSSFLGTPDGDNG